MANEECLELKNIKYQTMLLSGKSGLVSTQVDTTDIDSILEKEKETNRGRPWSKLGKATRMRKLSAYADWYSEEQGLTSKRKEELRQYLYRSLARKKLNRVKDVVYDKEKRRIKDIPGLTFSKIKSKFTLRRTDKKNSTLKGLAPRRGRDGKKTKIDIHLEAGE